MEAGEGVALERQEAGEHGEQAGLPEGEEEERFDAQKFGQGGEGGEALFSGEVEEYEAVQ